MTIAATVALVSLLALAQNKAGSDTNVSHETKAKAVNFLRLVNTTELMFHRTGGFADFDELKKKGELESVAKKFFPNDPTLATDGADPLPGWTFKFTMSKDQKNYQMAVRYKGMKSCAPLFYTDEGGVIYQSAALDCKLSGD